MPEIPGASVPLLRERLRQLSRIAFEEMFAFAADGDREAEARALIAISEMSETAARTAALVDARARAQIVREVMQLPEQRQLVGVLGNRDSFVTLPFDEAIQEVLSLKPIPGETATEVVQAYARREFALRQEINLEVTKAAQAEVARLLQTGGIVRDFQQSAQRFGEGHFSDQYAETVFRTEVTRAQTAGRINQSQSPALKGFIAAWRYNAVGDARTRPNHRALDRKMYAVDHEAWRTISPPNGWNCRCRLFMVTRRDAQRQGRLDEDGDFQSDAFPVAGGEPDEGFARSPAVEIYGTQ